MRETQQALDSVAMSRYIDSRWDSDILDWLQAYIRIPAKSPAFDPEWERNGFIEQAVQHALRWGQAQSIKGLTIEVIRAPGRTPVVFFEVDSTSDDSDSTVLFYGHLDKQPEFDGWRRGLGPWEPVYDGTRLYGRGGADDGYALCAALTAVLAVQKEGLAHPRCVGVIECCEESGSRDLPDYLEMLAPRLGNVELVICLDSGAGSYEQLWMCTSLRGYVGGALEVQVLDEGVHSGDAGGIVPSSLRVLRNLLERLEDSATGTLLPASLHCDIPPERLMQTRDAARILGDRVWKRFRWHCEEGQPVLPVNTDPEQALLNRTWRPTLEITGAEGLPPLRSAGNVLRPRTVFKLSLRLPPLVDSAAALAEIRHLLEFDPPYQARVQLTPDGPGANGWCAPPTDPWLSKALDRASYAHFDAPCGYIGQGGTIPLMGVLSRAFPEAQFMVCGVLGPESNAHGPNEFLHVPYARRLTACVASVLAEFTFRSDDGEAES